MFRYRLLGYPQSMSPGTNPLPLKHKPTCSDVYVCYQSLQDTSQSINQSMFISQATTHRIFQARKAFEQGHCLQVISQAKATGVCWRMAASPQGGGYVETFAGTESVLMTLFELQFVRSCGISQSCVDAAQLLGCYINVIAA